MSAYRLTCGHVVATPDILTVGGQGMCPIEYVMRDVVEDLSPHVPLRVTAVVDSDGKDTGETVYVPASSVINGTKPERSYGCSWGCGNPYDYILISVAGGDTEFLCLVCMLKLMQDMIMAVLNPQDPEVRKAMNDAAGIESAPMTSGKVRKRGKNAPADIDDDDLIEAFDSRIIDDE